ncbi:MAG: acetyl-CoA carboxylase biotin carboxyl carrier protein [Candidatus Krumholzibacteriia bacterium]
MQIDDVRQLVKLVEESGIEELEISSEGTTIRIQKRRSGDTVPSAPPQQFVYAAPVAPAAPAPAALSGVAEERARWKEFRSPIVGTFYRAAAPGAEPFVSVGDRIAVGQTVCIIEAMKVMNEIEAETAGIIREILVENASPVEAEAILFLIEPQ